MRDEVDLHGHGVERHVRPTDGHSALQINLVDGADVIQVLCLQGQVAEPSADVVVQGQVVVLLVDLPLSALT